MANSVTFPEALGGNGQTYTDDADPATGLDGLGYTVRFIPCLQQAVAMGLSAQSNAEAAADYVQQCQTLRNEAASSASAAAGSASTASTAASTATTKADEASGSATAAAGSASTASSAANTATTKAGEASGSASAAAGSASTASTAASTATTKAGESSDSASAAAGSASTASTAANTATTAADASVQAKNEAQTLYGDLNAVETAKTQAQQAATDAGEARAGAETARGGAETAQEAAETAAGQSEGAAAAAVQAHTEQTDPHSQYEQKTALKAAAYREVVGGTGDLMAFGAFGAGEVLDAQNIADFDLLPPGRSLTAQTDLINAPLTSGRFLVITDIRLALYSQFAIQRDTGRLYFRGASTLLQAKANGWATFYNNKNLLGSVSQEGGIPTGASFEAGFNASGRYIKFPSGDMWCAGQLSTSESNSVLWNFPVEFIDSNVQVQLTPGGTQMCSAMWDGPPTKNSVEISTRIHDGTASGLRIGRSVSAEASGRWY